jgi:hypothetical protein
VTARGNLIPTDFAYGEVVVSVLLALEDDGTTACDMLVEQRTV